MNIDRHRVTPVYQYSTLTAAEQVRLAADAISGGDVATFGARHLPEVERRVAARAGRAGAVAVDSGSAALALAVRALGVRAGQEVVIPEVGWVSIGTAAAQAGATVRVAPVDRTLTPSWEQLAPLVGPATGAVVLAHLRGRPAPDIVRIAAELAERQIPLIEDGAQAWGVTVGGRPAGAWGTVAAFSAQTYKMIAVGEGGFLLADDLDLLSFVRAVAGDTRVPTPEAVWRGKQRMTEVSAALALPQLDHLDALTADLRRLQRRLVDRLLTVEGISEIIPRTARDIEDGNGSLTGMWLPTPDTARRLASDYWRAGLRCWWPGPGDLHTAGAWPVQPARSMVEIHSYLDLQTPWLPSEHHDSFADHVAAVTTRTLCEVAV
ncbi:aminotransferase class I/II-fold pyridoxal phosphate-dependent enzyme [Frankia sp. Cr1]|uniref:aminotransferase class I/II-fold pyridoxal phosphate-dependent enzyme n=1 Tax=Frankia sp. Cr1 TaxID=3073931 RepID=UPI002AD3281D|nr:aminotransferase class I/II-fold pyridoxal phosphate-dependent enzyme [Frankia sp. Cr1]